MAKELKTVPSVSTKKKGEEKDVEFAFGKENYMLVFIGLGFIVLGFILMLGGGSDDPKVFNEAVFNFQRITLAPILILIGFVVEIFAIMKKPKN
jgi:hypothetical protein